MGVTLEKGSIVRGNWSKIEYKVEHTGTCKYGGWITARSIDNPLQTGSFSYLGKRVGNEILITDPRRPKDRLIIIKEIKAITGQLLFKFMSKKKGAARKPKQTRHPQRDE